MHEAEKELLSEFLHETIRATCLSLTFSIRLVPAQLPCLIADFTGSDVPALLHRHGELLFALEYMATQVLRLSPDQHDMVSFDAGGFKAQRDRALHRAAAQAISEVRATRQAFHFAPMSSRERRLLHLALASSGLHAASEGDPPRRHIVLHPE